MRYEVVYKNDENFPIAGFSFAEGLTSFLLHLPKWVVSSNLKIVVRWHTDKLSVDGQPGLDQWDCEIRTKHGVMCGSPDEPCSCHALGPKD